MPDPTADHHPTTAVQHEDSYFILRDCRELFVRRLVDILKEAIIASPALIDAFSHEVGAAHDELASATAQDGFGQTAGLTASRISLVGNDDLDLEIRIGNIANHLKGNERIDHWRVQLRYMTLLHQSAMTTESNPVGLVPIARGLWSICNEGNNTLDQKLDRLDRLEEQLQLRLPELYSELYDLLERHRVEPALVQAVQRGAGARPATGAGIGAPGANALSALQQAMHQQSGADDLAPAGFLTGNASGDSTGGSGVMLNASALIMLNHLMERLRVLESQQISAFGSNPASEAGEQPPLRALRAKDLDLPLGKPAAIALDTLSLIFEAIFAAPELPDAVKAAIGRLQIPLLKLAILDTSFFADIKHPARRLVNRMARAAIGLDQYTGRDHAVCVGLGKLADAVRSTLESNEADLSPHLDTLEALIATRDQALQTAARPYVQLVLEHENREASQSGAQAWLDKALAKTAHPVVRTFLSDFWFRVMQSAFSEGGAAGTRWKECDAAIEQLLWSFEPKQTAEERKTLLSMIPSLLKRINDGLDRLGVSSAERTPFLNTCFDLQTASLRSRPDAAPAAAERPLAPPPRPASRAAPSVIVLERDETRVRYLGLPTTPQPPWRTSGSSWKVGDWISFQWPEGERLCGLYCWQGSPSGTLLLFNPDWGFAAALAPALIEQQLREGRARIVSDLSLFDDAAERALSQMLPR